MEREQYNAYNKDKCNSILKKAMSKEKNNADGSTKGFFKYVK